MRLSELLLLADLATFPCENFNKTDAIFSSCLCRRNADGFTFESNEPDELFSHLLIGVDVVPAELIVLVVIDGDVFCAVLVFDGDAGVSVIDTGESANGPTRRAIFGGGLMTKTSNSLSNFIINFTICCLFCHYLGGILRLTSKFCTVEMTLSSLRLRVSLIDESSVE